MSKSLFIKQKEKSMVQAKRVFPLARSQQNVQKTVVDFIEITIYIKLKEQYVSSAERGSEKRRIGTNRRLFRRQFFGKRLN